MPGDQTFCACTTAAVCNTSQSAEPQNTLHLGVVISRFPISPACIGQLRLLCMVMVLPLVAILLPATLALLPFIARAFVAVVAGLYWHGCQPARSKNTKAHRHQYPPSPEDSRKTSDLPAYDSILTDNGQRNTSVLSQDCLWLLRHMEVTPAAQASRANMHFSSMTHWLS